MNPSRIDGIDTRWSLVKLAHADGTGTTSAEARRTLVLRYAGALRKYLGKLIANADDADELAQEVMMRLMRGDFAGADPGRGRFRDFLKAALRNMARSYWEKQRRRQTTDADLERVAGAEFLEAEWQSAWQRTVLDHAMNALKHADQSAAAAVLKLRAEFPDASSEELAAKLSTQLGKEIRPDTLRQMLRRARLRFAEFLVEELRRGLDIDTPARVLEELADLQLLEYVRDFLPADYDQTGTLQP